MAVKAAVMVAAVAGAKTVAEGTAATLTPTALAMMGAGNSRGRSRQQQWSRQQRGRQLWQQQRWWQRERQQRWHQQLWQQWGQATAGSRADNNQPKAVEMAIAAAVLAAAVTGGKIATEGAAAMLSLTALAMMGAGNSGGK
jgi:hypothetical protein